MNRGGPHVCLIHTSFLYGMHCVSRTPPEIQFSGLLSSFYTNQKFDYFRFWRREWPLPIHKKGLRIIVQTLLENSKCYLRRIQSKSRFAANSQVFTQNRIVNSQEESAQVFADALIHCHAGISSRSAGLWFTSLLTDTQRNFILWCIWITPRRTEQTTKSNFRFSRRVVGVWCGFIGKCSWGALVHNSISQEGSADWWVQARFMKIHLWLEPQPHFEYGSVSSMF